MDRLHDLETRLKIYEDCYYFERNEKGSVSHIEFFDPEYGEFPALDSNVLEALSNYTELKSITININNYVLKDLSSLRLLKKLKKIDIEDGQCDIDDIGVFSELKDLEVISFYGSKITDLNPLKYLSKLKSIVIYGSCIEDITPLSNLESLEILSLNQANIKDITPITHLKNLKSLALNKNKISDISILENHLNLNHLDLSANKIEDISALKHLNNLTNIGLSHNKIKEVSALKGKENLNYLNIQNNQINNIFFLNDCIKLNWLIISDNPIQKIKPVTELTELRTLQADNMKADDLGKDKFKSDLHWLSLSNCAIENIQFLESLKNLQVLNLNDNRISDVSVLSNFPQLRNVLLKNNNVEKPLPLPVSFYYGLQELDLRGNPFAGKFYEKYSGIFSISGEKIEEHFSLKDYNETVGKYFFEQQQYDEALAIYYYNRSDIEALEIYINKFTATSKNDLFHLRYYFSKIVNILALRKAEDSENLRKIVKALHKKIRNLNIFEKIEFSTALSSGTPRFSFHLKNSYKTYELYDKDKNTENADAEIYYALNSYIQKENLMEVLYHLKKLNELDSPFYYKLYDEIKECLRSRFSGSESDREQYNKYMDLLDNIENADIPVPDLKYVSNYNESKNYKEKSILQRYGRYFWLVFLILLLIDRIVRSAK
ncbi:Leucine Rich repeat-containing protein [Paenimyroides ummariense]|uniref:Leucine Rich repeat-containing protein n=1 Tax=Paenimyroides ummariense TaxID=913024 RepID=A0A1I4WFN0_9FLAO|nr:leucine-rich repeat domain-containing protein [Paenimyroides ummariense]SFN12488.1 Leucine Rich repeat-containing protein [Paenimyroides ummariense]